MAERKKRASDSAPGALPKELGHVNLKAAGIDVCSERQFVAIPERRDEVPVREFGTFTADPAPRLTEFQSPHAP
jgi:hypothetical protein